MSNQKKKKQRNKLSQRSKILYTIAVIVILIPLILLVYIYFGAKENSGKPTVGSRFDESLNPKITQAQIAEVKKTIAAIENVQGVEVNLISATLRINIDMVDQVDYDTIAATTQVAYESVDSIVAVSKYFTNNKSNDKMYDLEVHVYNFIPETPEQVAAQIYMIQTKTAAAKEPNLSIPSTPKNEDLANKLQLEQQAAAQNQ